MKTRSLAAEACRTAFVILLVAFLGTATRPAAADPHPTAPVAGPPPTSFAEASQLFRAGRPAAAFGRFARLANDGDREAARVALVMHRHGPALFGSAWDATTEELVQWSMQAQAADRAEIQARAPMAARAAPVGSPPGEAGYLATDTFRNDRRKKR